MRVRPERHRILLTQHQRRWGRFGPEINPASPLLTMGRFTMEARPWIVTKRSPLLPGFAPWCEGVATSALNQIASADFIRSSPKRGLLQRLLSREGSLEGGNRHISVEEVLPVVLFVVVAKDRQQPGFEAHALLESGGPASSKKSSCTASSARPCRRAD